jgi:fructose-1,6-bisphosphatase/inositol monophosphatase family enzyme
MPHIDHNKIAEIIREVAADKIVPRFQKLEDGHIKTKSGPNDLVTIADEEAEIELTRIFKDMMPGCQVIGEEAVSSGKVSRGVLQASDDYIWIVDPVDGTGNFARGEPIFGTMVALVKGGERIASWIFQIPRDRMVATEKGGGVTINGHKFKYLSKIADDAPFGEMSAFIAQKFMPKPIRPYVQKHIEQLKDASALTCCAFEYVSLLEGERAFSLYTRIEPWDHHAGVLIVEEAGFFSRHWDKSVYSGRDLWGGIINAPSEKIWDRVHAAFVNEIPQSVLQNYFSSQDL